MKTTVFRSADASHANDGSYHPHVTPLSMYWAVFGALLVLTVLTVGISELGIPQPWSLIIALAVATVKATLVCAFFMHLFFEVRSYTFILVLSVFFCGAFFGLTMLDLLTRDSVNPENGIHVPEHELRAAGKVPRGFVQAVPGAKEAGDHGGHVPAAHDAGAPVEGAAHTAAPADAAPAAH